MGADLPDLSVAVSSIATKRIIKKRSILLYQGEIPRMAYVIKSGLVKMYSLNDAGEEQIVAFHGPGDHFPSSWIFNKSRSTYYYYETVTNSEIYTLTREDLQAIMFRPEFVESTLNYFINSYSGMLMRVTALSQSRAREKILFTFYYLIFRYGKQRQGDIYEVTLPLTHQVLANLVGLARETISHEINKLKRNKVISHKGRTYSIDRAKLERLLGEDSFADFSTPAQRATTLLQS